MSAVTTGGERGRERRAPARGQRGVVCVPKSPASGFCVSCSGHGWPSVVRCLGHWLPRVGWTSDLKAVTNWRAPDTQKTLAEPISTHTARPTSHSHLTRRPAVARATAGKVLARGCARQGQSTRRRLSSPSTKWNTSTTWSVGRDSWPSLSSSWQRWCHLRPSRPDLALRSVDSLRRQGTQG